MDLAAVMRELAAREPILHQGASELTRADFETVTADDFWEVGASGTVDGRERVWAVLAARSARPEGEWEANDVRCRALGADSYLLTYRLRQDARITRRPSVWERAAGRWRLVYHQGTIVGDPAAGSGDRRDRPR